MLYVQVHFLALILQWLCRMLKGVIPSTKAHRLCKETNKLSENTLINILWIDKNISKITLFQFLHNRTVRLLIEIKLEPNVTSSKTLSDAFIRWFH